MQWKPKKIMTIDLVVFFFSSLSLSAFLPDSIHARFLSVPLSRFVVVRHKNAVIRQHLELYCLSIEYFCPGTWSLNQIALETAMGKWTRTEGTTCVSCFCYDRKLWDFFFVKHVSILWWCNYQHLCWNLVFMSLGLVSVIQNIICICS